MSLLDPENIIKSGGLFLIAFMVFAESGLLFGFFFPGDTLLFAAGLLASQGEFSIQVVTLVIAISAIAGGQVGYVIGERAGPRLFRKKDGVVFRREYVEQAETFYEKHGGKTIMLARFIPVVRTFAPVVAGIGNMDQRKFLFYNVAGSALWGVSVTLVGYYLGNKIPNIDTYILPIIATAMLSSFAPTLYHIARDKNSRQKIKQLFTARRSR